MGFKINLLLLAAIGCRAYHFIFKYDAIIVFLIN